MTAHTRTHENVTANAREKPPCLDAGGAAEIVQRALGVIEGRWKLAIVFRLFASSPQRFSALERSIDGISHKMLTAHLRDLERDGVVRRIVHLTVPPKVEYELTARGLALRPILRALREWENA